MMNVQERKEFLETHFDVPIEHKVTFVKGYCKYCGNSEFLVSHECNCHQDQGCGYTLEDEYGACDFCSGVKRCTKCNSDKPIEK